MSFNEAMEDFGVKLAFAEANAWEACPVFTSNQQKEQPMTTATLRKQRARNKAIAYGAVSVVLYTLTFMNADAIMDLCKKGHAYAVLPIATVFLFSWIHGTFTGNIWTALGIEGAAKKPAKAPTAEAPAQRPAARPRARVQA